ncbi:MAG: lamin tail domain-containing protein, partial [Bacteroidales bacterium]|nr:lamin tail domain-containing protein [Bacteroidales bacterium]
KFYTYNDFLSNIYNSVGGGQQTIVGITQLMEARVNYLNNHPLFQHSAPVIANITHTPGTVSTNSEVWLNAEVSNANIVKLAFRFLQTNKFEKIEMYDDGNHNDGAAGDGVYGVLISVGSTDVQYYIYAENADAVEFSPERAEYEYYTIEVSGDLVINEFMADNDTLVPDPSGEYDDWIEFYNNSNNTISLNGYYLSDESGDLTQWAFPDTIIGAGEYLIVWADKDEGQPGLHANFKLSKSGEEIVLVAPDTTIVDEVVFGAQPTDLSTGRYPNGTGTFVLMNPTFSTENTSGITGIEDELPNKLDFVIFPNPARDKFKVQGSRFKVKRSEVHLRRIQDWRVELFDLFGEKLLEKQIPAGTETVELDVSSLQSGFYLCKISTQEHSLTKKLIIQK